VPCITTRFRRGKPAARGIRAVAEHSFEVNALQDLHAPKAAARISRVGSGNSSGPRWASFHNPICQDWNYGSLLRLWPRLSNERDDRW